MATLEPEKASMMDFHHKKHAKIKHFPTNLLTGPCSLFSDEREISLSLYIYIFIDRDRGSCEGGHQE